jgi:glycogen operon protein
VELLLFDRPEDDVPARVVAFDRHSERTAGYWHAFVPGLPRRPAVRLPATGPWDPQRGLRFDGERLLLDRKAAAWRSRPGIGGRQGPSPRATSVGR